MTSVGEKDGMVGIGCIGHCCRFEIVVGTKEGMVEDVNCVEREGDES